MNVLIIAHFTDTPDEQGNNRFKYLAGILGERHDVTVLTTTFCHTRKKQRPNGIKSKINYAFQMCYEPGYAKNVSLKRIRSHRFFAKNVKKKLQSMKKPDVIYCAVPSLDVACVAAEYAKKNGIKFIVDVQDLWPEAFQMVIPISIVGKILFAPWKRKANKIYRAADEIVAVSQTYADRALSVNHKCEEAKVVYLGTDLETFDTYAAGDAPFAKEKDKLYLGYCGTLGASYDIPCVLKALDLMKTRGAKTPCFVVLGDGPQKETFEKMAAEKGLDVLFTGRLPYNEMCRYLSACDMLVNPIVKGAAQSIINKHADYAAAGKAVINTQECAEYRELVEAYGFGINCRVGDAEDVTKALEYLACHREERMQMGRNSRTMAEKLFDRKNSYLQLLDMVN